MVQGFDKIFFVYIEASKPRGVLYVGVTSNRPARAWQHRTHTVSGFTKRYWVDRLVYYEQHESAESAFKREKSMKRWRRDWKIELIEKGNPTWADLYNAVLHDHGLEPEC
jgi:putative endonuclease